MSENPPEQKKSTHRTEVVVVKEIQKHPNADTLGVIPVYGYTVVVKLNEWAVGDLMAYVVPDSLVSVNRPEMEFLGADAVKLTEPLKMVVATLQSKIAEYVNTLPAARTVFMRELNEMLKLALSITSNELDKKVRIRAMKLRGVMSFGLPLKAPKGAKEGDDVSDLLGVTRYEPPEELSTCTDSETAQSDLHVPHYDVEDGYRYNTAIPDGTAVVVSEKIDGTNTCYTHHGGRMWVRSRKHWRKEVPKSIYWKALYNNPKIAAWCVSHPDLALFGETFGCQRLKYGRKTAEFAVFDVWEKIYNRFMDYAEAREVTNGLPWVPVIICRDYKFDEIKKLVDGKSLIEGAGHHREGIVVRPTVEAWCKEIGRLQVKFVSGESLEKDR